MKNAGALNYLESNGKRKPIDYAIIVDLDDRFKISLDKSDIRLMMERVTKDGDSKDFIK